MSKAVFLDRDGVINVNIPNGYVTSLEELILLPNVAEAIKKLNEAQIPVFIISNQQGVGKGLMSQADLDAVDAGVHQLLRDAQGATIVKSYYCIHLGSVGCTCRKPKGGQLLKAASEYGLDLTRSLFIGDSPTDIAAGKDAVVGHCALVLSGATKSYVPGRWNADPDSVHKDLAAAVDWFLSLATD